ncbi:Galactose oxidase/kelch repeat superfamily protein [Actinidia rufa]|uniref:Galactose oxidase/kelch repeat superfamily protein n=1 Tax=Actinidia rufa TaxID=165716 RepID=A0A7J0ENQ0_9ERIC|nr:Galactose oxidase/kelch repeat superfamily protein [Actinidia rufa]
MLLFQLSFHKKKPKSIHNDQTILLASGLDLKSCCFINLDDKSAEDGCYSYIMRAGKPGTFKMLEPSSKPPSAKRSRKEKNRGRLPDASNSTEMMDQIWKEFPEDLFEAVIARLPIATFFRFRLVCTKWNSLLTSHSFSQQCTQVPQSHPWFYTITHENVNTGAMYDPSLKKWHHPTIPALPTKLIVLPVASAGGLVCFLDIGHRSFYVCNPLTRSFKELPARSVRVWSRVAVGMTLNGESTSLGYKILWVGCDGEYEIYESIKNSWTRPGSMPSNVSLPLYLNFRSQAVSIGGTLYFMRSDPDGIVSYDMDTGVWKQFVIPNPLHLSDSYTSRMWGADPTCGVVDKERCHMRVHLGAAEDDSLVEGGLLMLSLRSRQMNRLVTYDISSREWLKVPGCVLPRGRKRQWIACGTAFHPCLTASA